MDLRKYTADNADKILSRAIRENAKALKAVKKCKLLHGVVEADSFHYELLTTLGSVAIRLIERKGLGKLPLSPSSVEEFGLIVQNNFTDQSKYKQLIHSLEKMKVFCYDKNAPFASVITAVLNENPKLAFKKGKY